MKLSLVMPAYNEAEIIQASTRAVDEYLSRSGSSYEIIVGDAGSTDGTGDLVEALGLPSVRVVRDAAHGKGSIISACFERSKGEFIGFLDSDLEIDPGYIEPMMKALENGCDVAIASKTIKPEYQKDRPLARRLATGIYNGLVRMLFDTGISDHQAGLKIFRGTSLRPVLPEIRNTGWLWDTEVLVTLVRDGWRVSEIPVTTRSRRRTKVRMMNASWQMFRDLLRLYGAKRKQWRG